jgi:diguanylate cyclase (GGDEF)-like protein/PAS domain S-box-containing protein
MPPEAKHEPDGAAEIDYKFLAENCADILCSVGADHVIHYVSPSCLDILGWKPVEMIGKDFGDFVFPEGISVLEDVAAAGIQDGAATSHARVLLMKKDQAPVWISINTRCVRDPETGDPRNYVLTMRDITERKVLEEKLSALAMTDALTGLWNRRAFDQALRREWKRTSRKESELSLLLLDLDDFKPLNDQYGHPLGDECLAAVASTISDSVRATDVVCRWGGDEVAIILPATDQAGALKAAEKIRSAIEVLRFRSKKNSDECVSVTASIGVATALPEPDGMITAPQNLLLAADRALYRAKHDGHNRVAVYSGSFTKGIEVPETIVTTKSADMKLGYDEPEQHTKDGLVLEGLPDGIDGL